jgi:hypothetical protein
MRKALFNMFSVFDLSMGIISPLGMAVMVNKKRIHHVCSHFKQTWGEYKKMPWGFMQLHYKRKFYRVALNFK